jgi:hypothetical protein
VRFERGPLGVQAIVTTKASIGGRVASPLSARVILPDSASAEDPKNAQRLTELLATTATTARRYGQQLTRAKAAVHAIANEVLPDQNVELLSRTSVLAGDP